jgi:hypothetical protein
VEPRSFTPYSPRLPSLRFSYSPIDGHTTMVDVRVFIPGGGSEVHLLEPEAVGSVRATNIEKPYFHTIQATQDSLQVFWR